MQSFGAKSFVSQYAIQKHRDQDIQKCKFEWCFVWYEAWSLGLREKRRLKVFDSRVVRKIFGPKRSEVIGKTTRLHK